MRPRYTRRQVCATGLLAGASLLAGCQDNGGATTPGTVEPTGVVQNVGFDRSDLVVDLQEDHEVTQVNLIDPNGERFTGTSVARGEMTSRLQLLDMREGLGGYEHYEPGTYRLVAIHGETETSVEVDLQPDLRIVAVEQYRDGERNADFGKLAVTVENVGTGPTWVYDLTYRDAPNYTANDPLINDPGNPRIHRPESDVELVLEPEHELTLVSARQPILFRDQEEQQCSGRYEMTVLVGVASGGTVEKQIAASVAGETITAGSVGQYTCSEVSINTSEENTGGE